MAAAVILGVMLPKRLWLGNTYTDIRSVPTPYFDQSTRFKVMDIYFSATVSADGIETLMHDGKYLKNFGAI